jgi:putative two-component system response regulator
LDTRPHYLVETTMKDARSEENQCPQCPELISSGIRAEAGLARPPYLGSVIVASASSDHREVLGRELASFGLRVHAAHSGSEAAAEHVQRRADALFFDFDSSPQAGLHWCRVLKAEEANLLVPIFFFSRSVSTDGEIAALEAGADGMLQYPFSRGVAHARIVAALRRKHATAAHASETESVLLTLGQFVDERDALLGKHCQRLAAITGYVGLHLGLPAHDILTLQRASYLHDVGKIGVPDLVLFKPGPLTESEWELMKTHAERGEKICSSVRSLAPVLPLIRHHHERWDGTGYPDKLRGEDIPLLARILQLADIYDALTAERSYKPACTSAQAIAILKQEADRGWRDPALVELFARLSPSFDVPGTAEVGMLSLQSLALSLDQSSSGQKRSGNGGSPLPAAI